MKKKILKNVAILSLALFGFGIIGTNLLYGIHSPIHMDDDNYSCSATSKCFNIWGTETGEVSCTGTECRRAAGWVECNGKRTKC